MPIPIEPEAPVESGLLTGRLRFPSTDDRLAYKSHGPGLPFLSEAGKSVVIYTNEAGSVLADIVDDDGVPIIGSTLIVDNNSQIPEFYGPVGVEVLYARLNGGPASPIFAWLQGRYNDFTADLAALQSEVDALEAFVDSPINPVINVRAYGAVGDGVTDDTIAIQAALTAVGSGIVFFPAGMYLCSGELNMSGKSNITLKGVSSETGGAISGAVLKYSGTASRFINNTDSNGIKYEGMVITYSSAGFTGSLVDCTGSNFINFSHITFTGNGAAINAARAALLNSCTQITFNSCNFLGTVDGVKGTVSGADYSEIVRFYDCNFGTSAGAGSLSGHAIVNPHINWLFVGCNFEPSVAGNANAVVFTDPTQYADSVGFFGCWFGDVVLNPGPAWIEWSGSGHCNLTATDCSFGLQESVAAINIGGAGNQFGLVVTGCSFTSQGAAGLYAINFNGGGLGHAFVAGNFFNNMTTGCLNTAVNVSGSLIETMLGDRVLGGRLIKGYSGGTPAVSAGSALGTAPPAPTISGDDTRGKVSMGTGTSPNSNSRMVSVTFASAYPSPPTVVICPVNGAIAPLHIQVANVSTTQFEVWLIDIPAASQGLGTYQFNYIVIG